VGVVLPAELGTCLGIDPLQILIAMGFFSLVAVLVLLLFAGGTDAARLYPTSHEVLAC
jgi:hypothetical protein